MKKHSFIILLTTLGLGTFTACEKVLDVQPTTAIEAEGAVSDYTSLNSAALGAYSALQSTDYYGLRYLMYQEIYSDNMEHRGTFTTDQDVSARRINASNLNIADIWTAIYQTINRANYVMSEAERLTNITEDQRKQIIGEMSFVRALAYFDLVKVFGGVPLQTSAVTGLADVQSLPRATEAEVYNLIVSDLQNAEANLPVDEDDPASTTKIRANSAAASALLARVYLQRGNYAEAEAKATSVIARDYTLVPSFATLFNTELNSESIFEIDFTTNDQNGLASGSNPGTTGQRFYLRAGTYTALQASAENGDTRFAVTTEVQNNRNRLLKYNDITNNAENVMVIRLAEMYLIRAEAIARQASGSSVANEQVIDDINAIRTRAELAPVSNLTNDAALIEILAQRRLEFVGEGLRFMDLKRYNLTGTVLGFSGSDVFRNLWPIPLQQVEVNPALQQNQGY